MARSNQLFSETIPGSTGVIVEYHIDNGRRVVVPTYVDWRRHPQGYPLSAVRKVAGKVAQLRRISMEEMESSG